MNRDPQFNSSNADESRLGRDDASMLNRITDTGIKKFILKTLLNITVERNWIAVVANYLQ